METLISKLKGALRDEFGDDPGFDLMTEVSDSGSVTAVLTTERFEDLREVERQQEIWEVLERELAPEEQSKINIVLANTPEETRVFEHVPESDDFDDFEDRLGALFRQSFDDSAVVELHDIGQDRVTLSVQSGSFDHKSEAERQQMVWDLLDDKLAPQQRKQVRSVRPMTPDEAERTRRRSAG